MGNFTLKKIRFTISDPKYPFFPYKDYSKELSKLLDDLEPKLLQYKFANKFVVKNDIFSEIDRIIKRIEREVSKWDIVKIIRNWAESVALIHDRRLTSEVKKKKSAEVLLLPLQKITDKVVKKELEKRIEYNVSLIKTVSERLKSNIENDLKRAFTDGTGESVKEIIQKNIGKSHRNFDLIARNETLQLNKQLTLAKMKPLGVEKYIYRTSKDEKVRITHSKLDGKEFEVEGDNEGNKRLAEINCRCHREFIFEI